jgi:hypothetical protein
MVHYCGQGNCEDKMKRVGKERARNRERVREAPRRAVRSLLPGADVESRAKDDKGGSGSKQ